MPSEACLGYFDFNPVVAIALHQALQWGEYLRSIDFGALDGQQLLGVLSLTGEKSLLGHVDIGNCMAACNCRVDPRQPIRACVCCDEADVPATLRDSEFQGILSSL